MRVEIVRPGPTLAFGRLDRARAGYDDAKRAATEHGFAILEREPGGHAAAYDEGSLVIDITGEGGIDGITRRFEWAALRMVGALHGLGVDARVGEVAGEYCPGTYSVNVDGRRKVAGFAQRVRGNAFTIGASITVENPDRVVAVLTDVYAALELDFDPLTVGVPGPPIDTVEQALREAYSRP